MPAPSKTFMRYGLPWNHGTDPLQIEFYMIQNGGFWRNQTKKEEYGEGLFFHYKQAMTLLWPNHDWHRWAELTLREYINNTVTCLLGPKDCGKTWMASKIALIEYWIAPTKTCVVVTSTETRGMELRIWGTIKELYNEATSRWPDLPGQVYESLHSITTVKTPDEYSGRKQARVLNQGLICIPTMQGGQYVGIGKYKGLKQDRIVFIADEVDCCGPTFLSAVANLCGKGYFKFMPMGNPNDPLDPLGQAAEPVNGWASLPEVNKTTVWPSRFMNGKTINFIGFDTPNNDFPKDEAPRYPYLPTQAKIDEIEHFWGRDSMEFWSQAGGAMKTGLLLKRVINEKMCEEHHAFDKPVWKGTPTTKVYAVDAAYSGIGGDRCVGIWMEFGEDADGLQILAVHGYKIIPVQISLEVQPEDQIAAFVKEDTEGLGIVPENVFYDSTGRGTLGAAFARIWGTRTPQPIEFGGKPSTRPVRHDLYIEDRNEHNGKRLKRCNEHYCDFVTELWFSSRFAIECNQLRGLPKDVMKEGQSREYGRGKNNLIFVESKHDPKARERMKRSPDLYDSLVCGLEGARQRGFEIKRLGASLTEKDDSDDYWQREAREFQQTLKSKSLQLA